MDRPDELEQVKYPDYSAKWEIFADYNSVPQSRCLHVYNDAQGRHVCQRLKVVISRWKFLTSLDGEEYYYQQLLLNIPFRREKDLLSDSNVKNLQRRVLFKKPY